MLGGPGPVQVGQEASAPITREHRGRGVRDGVVVDRRRPAPLGRAGPPCRPAARWTGSISNALDHATSPCEGSGRARPARLRPVLVTRAISRAWRTRLAASVRAARRPWRRTRPRHRPRTRTPMPKFGVVGRCVSGTASRRRTVLASGCARPGARRGRNLRHRRSRARRQPGLAGRRRGAALRVGGEVLGVPGTRATSVMGQGRRRLGRSGLAERGGRQAM